MKTKKNFIYNLKEFAIKNDVPIINDEGLAFLLELITKYNVKHILEIGTAIGYSAINMANLDTKIITVERDYFMYNEALKNIKEANLEENIQVLYADALEVEINHTFDLIFIDAAKAQYQKFFEKFKFNLNPQGIIVCDNLNFHNLDINEVSRGTRQLLKKIQKFKDFLKENEEFETIIYDIGDGISVSKRR
ncbi:MAG TPA: O-methyltransferase [Acholeplasmataceae bacterium]|nr:O-methyltransferase [Acholeplasmataceae bacterium]HQC30317.1 O-methyltransferase [Acholeplasmataceae bacterium]